MDWLAIVSLVVGIVSIVLAIYSMVSLALHPPVQIDISHPFPPLHLKRLI